MPFIRLQLKVLLPTLWPSGGRVTKIQKEVEEFGFQKSVFPCEERVHVGSKTGNNELPKESEKVPQSYLQVLLRQHDAQMYRFSPRCTSQTLNPFLPSCSG